uniref:Uncharacterized protein n=1 Tax=Tetraselmis sp. GSL018 TaxID=582737 RepID=A0A061RT84_9CHLO
MEALMGKGLGRANPLNHLSPQLKTRQEKVLGRSRGGRIAGSGESPGASSPCLDQEPQEGDWEKTWWTFKAKCRGRTWPDPLGGKGGRRGVTLPRGGLEGGSGGGVLSGGRAEQSAVAEPPGMRVVGWKTVQGRSPIFL